MSFHLPHLLLGILALAAFTLSGCAGDATPPPSSDTAPDAPVASEVIRGEFVSEFHREGLCSGVGPAPMVNSYTRAYVTLRLHDDFAGLAASIAWTSDSVLPGEFRLVISHDIEGTDVLASAQGPSPLSVHLDPTGAPSVAYLSLFPGACEGPEAKVDQATLDASYTIDVAAAGSVRVA